MELARWTIKILEYNFSYFFFFTFSTSTVTDDARDYWILFAVSFKSIPLGFLNIYLQNIVFKKRAHTIFRRICAMKYISTVHDVTPPVFRLWRLSTGLQPNLQTHSDCNYSSFSFNSAHINSEVKNFLCVCVCVFPSKRSFNGHV